MAVFAHTASLDQEAAAVVVVVVLAALILPAAAAVSAYMVKVALGLVMLPVWVVLQALRFPDHLQTVRMVTTFPGMRLAEVAVIMVAVVPMVGAPPFLHRAVVAEKAQFASSGALAGCAAHRLSLPQT